MGSIAAVVVFAAVSYAVYYVATASKRRAKNKGTGGHDPKAGPKNDKQ